MKTTTLVISVAFIGLVLRQAMAPGAAFIEWEEWLVICTALATVGFLLHDWKHARQTEGQISDLYHRVGTLEGGRHFGEHIESRLADLQSEVAALKAEYNLWYDTKDEEDEDEKET